MHFVFHIFLLELYKKQKNAKLLLNLKIINN
jgi:hypothetical protein